MNGSPADRNAIEAELEKTAFQRKAVTRGSVDEAARHAIAFFSGKGYKAGRTGRPNQVYIRGGREGLLPVVHAELLIQTNVGRGNVTMVTVSGAGERLREALQSYVDELREAGGKARQQESDTI